MSSTASEYRIEQPVLAGRNDLAVLIGIAAVAAAAHSPTSHVAKGPYALRLAVSARAQLKSLDPSEWREIHHKLEELMALATQRAPPSRELLEEAGFSPPYLRARAGGYVLVYDADPEKRVLTVLHVLRVPKR